MDLSDATTRAEITSRLAARFAGRPVILGPSFLAGVTDVVRMFGELGSRVMVVSMARGAGPIPAEDECELVEVEPPPATSMTEEVRQRDWIARHLPDEARQAIDRFDPDRDAVWFASPFVTTDESIDGRPVVSGRPAAWVALEDKMLCDDIWDAANVVHAPYRIVDNDPDALAKATDDLAGPMGAVWAGDARDGLNGGGDYVRWVIDESDHEDALSFFGPRCDRIRVMPFLDGVACSIHGFVLADGTAAFRPVEIVTLRNRDERRIVYSGLGTYWDPPEADREEMRQAATRVGGVLSRRYGFRGAFGIDGVLTADGFRPTELNPRMTGGANVLTGIDRPFFRFLQAACVTDPARVAEAGVSVEALETFVPLMDTERVGRVAAVGEDIQVGVTDDYTLSWDGERFARREDESGNTLSIADTPSGFFAMVDPCSALRVGERMAPVNRALLAFLDGEYGVGFGELEVGEDVRTGSIP